jgi:hypothetical protein
MGKLHSYLCAIKVDPFCCVVFQKAPISWMVEKKKGVYSLTPEEWVGMMVDDDPGKRQKTPPSLLLYFLLVGFILCDFELLEPLKFTFLGLHVFWIQESCTG